MARTFVDADFVRVFRKTGDTKIAFHLYFGDEITMEPAVNGWTRITATARAMSDGTRISGFVKGPLPVREAPILKVSMIDVQQGDGMVLETPSGKVVLIDGGDNKLFARHLAARFRALQTTKDNPLPVEAIIITHGDADHFTGLSEIRKSETLTGARKSKRIFIKPKRVFHNGLVKGPSKLRETEQFGATVNDAAGRLMITALYEDIRDSAPEARNGPFQEWIDTIDHWSDPDEPIQVTRVGLDKNLNELFGFLKEDGLKLEFQGPFVDTVTTPGGQRVPALEFLHAPPKTAMLHEVTLQPGGGLSASHTINGHSIAFRLQFGNVRFLFTGDLNKESMARMEARFAARDLQAEILKTPHHGSAEFDLKFLRKVRPVVSLVSSGDESARKEYIHPRATLMNALGSASRNDTGLVFSTELTAFFAYRDVCYTRPDLKDFFKKQEQESFTKAELVKMFTGEAEGAAAGEPTFFNGFERTQFGMIEIRTDGERVLVFTHSGLDDVFEAYRFRVTRSANGRITVKFEDDVDRKG